MPDTLYATVHPASWQKLVVFIRSQIHSYAYHLGFFIGREQKFASTEIAKDFPGAGNLLHPRVVKEQVEVFARLLVPLRLLAPGLKHLLSQATEGSRPAPLKTRE